MNVLVAAASKYGATAEIAGAIGEELRSEGIDADVMRVEDVTSLDGFDAVVLGSAVYAGHWLGPAKDLVERHGQEWVRRPVWLFSSGPVGAPPKPEEDPVDISVLSNATGARGHRVFAGRIDRSRLNFFEKAIVIALRAPEGDFRDWDAIREWAMEIASELQAGSTGAAR